MPVAAGAAFAFGLACTALLTAGLRRLLLRLSHVDRPRPDRWHTTPVPRPGGPAIFGALIAGALLWLPRPWEPVVWGWLAGGTFIFVVGLIDDFAGLANPSKLALLIIGATIPLLFGVTFRPLPDLIGIPAALLWILAITNAMNWLDNMDGLAAGVGFIAAGTLAVLSVAGGGSIALVGSGLVAGVCAGFLLLNFSPARIFMGDSGSGVLGMSLAVLALWGSASHRTNVVVSLLLPLMVLSIPIFDSAIVTITRLFNGRGLFQGGKDHPSHRLVVLGLSERQAVLALYALSLGSAAAAFVASRQGVLTGIVLAGVLGCGLIATGIVLTRVRVYEQVHLPPNGRMVVLWQVMHKRRLLEMSLDLLLIALAYLAAYLLRFEGDIPPSIVRRMGQVLPAVIGIKMAALYLTGVYRGDWRSVGLLDLLPLIRGATLGSITVVAVLFMWSRLADQSRTALVIDWFLSLGLLGGMRVSVRLLQEYFATLRLQGRRVLIAGAGQGGLLLLNELRHNPALRYRPIGFVDDDSVKQGAVIRGVPVLGSTRDIPVLVPVHGIEAVLVAAPSMSPESMERIALICAEAGVPCRLTRPLLEPATE